tara:strand:- start:429 stop:1340 length:912 start_codon:yes stop_codon:yes gene_type:complete
MNPQIGDLSEDGYWVLTAEGWQPSEKQIQALDQGAAPHTESNSQQAAMVTLTPDAKKTQSTNRMKYIFSGAIAFTLVLLLFGMYLDSWTVPNEEPEEAWLVDAEVGLGLTEFTIDCSEVTGTDPDTGEKNKDMCKFAAGLSSGEITMWQAANSATVEELTNDLSTEISGPISEMCSVIEEASDDSKESRDAIESCESRESAGTTAMVLFWLSFVSGFATALVVIISVYKAVPYSNEVEKFGSLVSGIFALLGLIIWLILKPENDGIGFASAFYLTLLCIVLFSALAALQFIRPKSVGDVVLFE